MRKTNFTLLSVLALLFACGGAKNVDDNSTPELLSQTVLTALRQNDKPTFEKYIVQSKDELEAYLTGYYGRELSSGLRKPVDEWDERKEPIIKSFDFTLKRANENGLSDWSGVQFKDMTFRDVSKNGKAMYADVKIQFTKDDYLGVLLMENIIQTENGWKLYKPIKLTNYTLNPYQ
ncbi:MAG: hypothetical protein Tsb0034_13140 [Ekhidna sp.]